MQQLSEQKVQSCATTTAQVAAKLATAATLCIYEGSDALAAGVSLSIAATVTDRIARAYQNLLQITPLQDLYNVSLSEPPRILAGAGEIQFEQMVHDFVHHLLTLHLALNNLHHSYARYETTIQTIQTNPDPEDPVHQDAQFFQVLQHQAIYRQLSICAHMHAQILENAARINFHWHHYQQNLPNNETFTSDEIKRTINITWQDHTQEIKDYNLPAFEVHGPYTMPAAIEQQQVHRRPQLLLNGDYHRSLQQLLLSYQETMDTFYEQKPARN